MKNPDHPHEKEIREMFNSDALLSMVVDRFARQCQAGKCLARTYDILCPSADEPNSARPENCASISGRDWLALINVLNSQAIACRDQFNYGGDCDADICPRILHAKRCNELDFIDWLLCRGY